LAFTLNDLRDFYITVVTYFDYQRREDMRRLPTLIFLFTVLFIFAFNQKSFAQNDETLLNQIMELNWQSTGNYELNRGNAKLSITSEEKLIQGKDAHKYMFLTEGHSNFEPDAVVYRFSGPNIDTQLIYQFHKTGYLNTDDWDEYIEKDALMQEIKKNTEAVNKIKKPGYPKLYVDGWAQEPLLDKTGSMVYWAISLHTDNGDKVVNAKVIKLARKGYTEIIWLGHPELFVSAESSLTPALKAY
jgi:uncharacterized membrane-anchored protein